MVRQENIAATSFRKLPDILLFVGVLLFTGLLQPVSQRAYAEGLALAEPLLKAHEHYRGGEFTQALSKYQEVLDTGHKSFGIHFNMGNTHYRLGNRAEALSHFRLAQDQRPRDPEVAANADLILKSSGAAQPQDLRRRQGWFDFIPWKRWGSLSELAGLTLFALGVLLGSLGAARLTGAVGAPAAAAVAALVAIGGALGTVASWVHQQPQSRGIVKEAATPLRSEASAQSLELFQLPVLAEVRVVDVYPEAGTGPAQWARVRFDGSTAGWVKAEKIAMY